MLWHLPFGDTTGFKKAVPRGIFGKCQNTFLDYNKNEMGIFAINWTPYGLYSSIFVREINIFKISKKPFSVHIEKVSNHDSRQQIK